MTKVICDMAVSVDGFTAGPNQSADKPFGDGPVDRLHRGCSSSAEANAAEIEAIVAAGAFIMGRNMFGPGRGEWDESWTGWWGDDPPYHAPVFVLTHLPREPVQMQGGTTFTLRHRRDRVGAGAGARGGRRRATSSIAGGASTVNQYLAAGAIDELRLHVAPVVLGVGERLFDGVGPLSLERSGSTPPTSSRTSPTAWPARAVRLGRPAGG